MARGAATDDETITRTALAALERLERSVGGPDGDLAS
jgi:hypothetical protein